MDDKEFLRHLTQRGKQDQLEAASREFAALVAAYYHQLLTYDLPETLAGYLTGQYQSMLLVQFLPHDGGSL